MKTLIIVVVLALTGCFTTRATQWTGEKDYRWYGYFVYSHPDIANDRPEAISYILTRTDQNPERGDFQIKYDDASLVCNPFANQIDFCFLQVPENNGVIKEVRVQNDGYVVAYGDPKIGGGCRPTFLVKRYKGNFTAGPLKGTLYRVSFDNLFRMTCG